MLTSDPLVRTKIARTWIHRQLIIGITLTTCSRSSAQFLSVDDESNTGSVWSGSDSHDDKDTDV